MLLSLRERFCNWKTYIISRAIVAIFFAVWLSITVEIKLQLPNEYPILSNDFVLFASSLGVSLTAIILYEFIVNFVQIYSAIFLSKFFDGDDNNE